MLENFVYSLNATIPVFLVIVLGYLLGRAKMLNDNFVTVANRLTYSITLPVMLFLEISGMDAASLLDFRFLAFGFLSSLACILLIWGGARLFLKDKSMVGSFVQGSYRGSAALLGVALMQNIYGSASYASIMILAAAPLYNIMAVIILTIEGRRTEGAAQGGLAKQALLGVLKNPIIWGILLGLPFAVWNLRLPRMFTSSLQSVSSVATPLALLAIGASFRLDGAKRCLGPALWATFLKLIAQAAVFLPVAVWLGFTGERLVALLIMFASPTATASYIMAVNLGNDGDLSSSIIVYTTLFSAATVTAWIFLLRSLSLI